MQKPVRQNESELAEDDADVINAKSLIAGSEEVLDFGDDGYQSLCSPLLQDAISEVGLGWNVPDCLFNSSLTGHHLPSAFSNNESSEHSVSGSLPQPSPWKATPNPMAPAGNARDSPTTTPLAGNYRQLEAFLINQNDSALEIEKGVAVIYGRVEHDLVALQKPLNTRCFLMTQVVWGQVRAYPKMSIDNQLPPFIYPSCVLEDKLPETCVANGVHQCLREPLAICVQLVRMFYGRTRASAGYVWKTIYAEQARLNREVPLCPDCKLRVKLG